MGRGEAGAGATLVYRSNTGREVGFLGERRRLNVAVTRARRQVCGAGEGRERLPVTCLVFL